MIRPKFFGKITKGHLFLDNRWQFDGYVNQWEGKEVEVTIAKRGKKRTSGQPDEDTNFNGYYWGVVIPLIAKTVGDYDYDSIHYWVQMAVGNVKGMKNGIVIPAGTSEMTGGTFSEYCGRVRTWASKELDCFIPEPYETDY